MTGVRRIQVAGESPYEVVVGAGASSEVVAVVGAGVRRVAVVSTPSLRGLSGAVLGRLAAADVDVHVVEVPDGEAAKTAQVAAECWAQLGRLGFTRSDAVVAVGGGSTTDLAGFVAATFLRGIAVVHVPTTLLGMVDAAVGGKTGINTAEGKNLVGSFHEPVAVLCDLELLRSLQVAELRSGLAEVVKCGFVTDRRILDVIRADPGAVLDVESAALREVVERAVSVKARVVAADLRESTSSGSSVGREVLNYGHTLGHAIERVEGYRRRHGEAVAIGMVYVAELARLTAGLADEVVDLHREVLESVGLPTTYRPEAWGELRDAMRVDKKARGDRLRFVVLTGLGEPMILDGPAEDALVEAYARISAES